MWFEQVQEQIINKKDCEEQKLRVGTLIWSMIQINDDVLNNDDDSDTKLNELLKNLKIYADAGHRNFAQGHDRNCGVHIKEDDGNGKRIGYIYINAYYVSQEALFKYFPPFGNTEQFLKQIQPYLTVQEMIVTTVPDEYDFWNNAVENFKKTWYPELKCRVMKTKNERDEKKLKLNLKKPTINELCDVAGLPFEQAKKFLIAMDDENFQPNRSEEAIVHTFWKLKDECINDEEKVNEIQLLTKEWAGIAQTIRGTLALTFAYSAEDHGLISIEHYDSTRGFESHVGWCSLFAAKLVRDYVYLDEYLCLCGSKETVEYYTEIGRQWQPKSKLLVLPFHSDLE